MIKEFLMKQMMKRQTKNMPKDQQEKIMELVSKNPELFQKIGEEVDRRVKKGGESQMKATMEVMKKYQNELRETLGQ